MRLGMRRQAYMAATLGAHVLQGMARPLPEAVSRVSRGNIRVASVNDNVPFGYRPLFAGAGKSTYRQTVAGFTKSIVYEGTPGRPEPPGRGAGDLADIDMPMFRVARQIEREVTEGRFPTGVACAAQFIAGKTWIRRAGLPPTRRLSTGGRRNAPNVGNAGRIFPARVPVRRNVQGQVFVDRGTS